MKHFFALAAYVSILVGAVPAFAATELIWNANVEPDMKMYNVYLCKVKGCTASDAGALWAGKVDHVAGKTQYTFPLPVGIEGAAVVTAQDLAGNNSVPSNMVSFTSVPNLPPAAPSGLMTR